LNRFNLVDWKLLPFSYVGLLQRELVWRLAGSLCQVIAVYALRLNSRAGTDGSTVSSLICDRWLILGLETLSISRRLSMALTRAPLNWTHGARCAWAMAVHHTVGISCQRDSGYRPSRVSIMAQDLSTPDPSLSPTHFSIRRGRATTTHTIRLAWWCRATLH